MIVIRSEKVLDKPRLFNTQEVVPRRSQGRAPAISPFGGVNSCEHMLHSGALECLSGVQLSGNAHLASVDQIYLLLVAAAFHPLHHTHVIVMQNHAAAMTERVT